MVVDAARLLSWAHEARRRTIELYADLSDRAMAVPYMRIINPPVWELGHVAWFQEHWVLRHALGQRPIHSNGDALWNSAIIAHADRWTAALPSRAATFEYLELVGDRVRAAIEQVLDPKLQYFALLAVFHEDMHGEAFAYTRQTLGWPAPHLSAAAAPVAVAGNLGLQIGDTVDVAAFGDFDSARGCRQMFGNVWEWTATAFEPYPGFERDPYKEYSEPWFGDHRVLRGGCFVTQPRLLRPTWRNFYPPDRRDVWAGFRTCAID